MCRRRERAPPSQRSARTLMGLATVNSSTLRQHGCWSRLSGCVHCQGKERERVCVAGRWTQKGTTTNCFAVPGSVAARTAQRTTVAAEVKAQVGADQEANGGLVADHEHRLSGVRLDNVAHVRQRAVEDSQPRFAPGRGVCGGEQRVARGESWGCDGVGGRAVAHGGRRSVHEGAQRTCEGVGRPVFVLADKLLLHLGACQPLPVAVVDLAQAFKGLGRKSSGRGEVRHRAGGGTARNVEFIPSDPLAWAVALAWRSLVTGAINLLPHFPSLRGSLVS